MRILFRSFAKHNRLSILQFMTEDCDCFYYLNGLIEFRKKVLIVRKIKESNIIKSIQIVNPLDHYLLLDRGDVLIPAINYALERPILLPPLSGILMELNLVETNNCKEIKYSLLDDSESIRSVDECRIFDFNFDETFFEIFRDEPEEDSDQDEEIAENVSEMMEETLSNFRKELYNQTIEKFPMHKPANGIACFLDNKLLSIDLFSSSKDYEFYYPAFLFSMLNEVYRRNNRESRMNEKLAYNVVSDIFSIIDKLKYKEEPAIGAGVLKSIQEDNIGGFILTYNDRIIRMSLIIVS